MTINDLHNLMEESNAAVLKLITRDKDDKPISAIILVSGEETQEILDAVEAVEATFSS